jgi:hypothetical protein
MIDAGVSQLMAHLVLAPIASTPQDGASSNTTLHSTFAATTTPSQTFLLAPSSSSNGIKLQMVEVPPLSSNTRGDSWKYVRFQAVLSSNSDNKPHLYCAVVEPSNKLQMELCDEEQEERRSVGDGSTGSRIFLYDSSTGEVMPSQLGAADDKQASVEAVSQAIAQLSGSGTGTSASMAAKRQSQPDQSLRRPVKLVFFADEYQQAIETSSSPSSGMSADDKPPLLRNDQT